MHIVFTMLLIYNKRYKKGGAFGLMKKKVLNIIPYLIGLIYLAYCLSHVHSWVTSHLEDYLFFAALVWVVAAICTIISLVLTFTVKRKFNFYLPAFFLVIGLIVYIVAINIPCCTGG